ncbi:MAG: hypothetical protein M3R00_05435 [Pseudomonadota bacterium]|nr:hypothetical protein [Pseudomonadota bacterium]
MFDTLLGKATKAPCMEVADQGKFIQLRDFAKRSQCQHWMQIILNHDNEWIERDPGAWSFGNAWYFDIEAGLAHQYFANAESSNRLIRKLPGYLDTMRDCVRHILNPNGEICLDTRARHENLGPYWCESGLHIYEGDYDMSTEVGGVHQDLEGLIPYPHLMFADDTVAYSAVLSIAVPEKGGGLNVWKTRFIASNAFPDLSEDDKVELDYQVGTMTIIDSFMPHQIQDIVCSEKNPLRITGVMHFLYRQDPYPHWEYWF